MTLDALLSNLSLDVQPFAFCDVRCGSRLILPGPRAVTLHFVLSGQGVLRTSKGENAGTLRAGSMALVPPGVKHSLESQPTGHEVHADPTGWKPPDPPESKSF